MPAGRPSKPLEQKRLTGRTSNTDSGGRPLPAPRTSVPADAATGVPRAPSGLGKRGALEWRKVWTAGKGWLKPAQDYPWVEMSARAWDDIDAFRAAIAEDGLVLRDDYGKSIAHPLIAEVRRAEATIQKCLSMIGFSPSDRARLGWTEVQTASKLKTMMQDN